MGKTEDLEGPAVFLASDASNLSMDIFCMWMAEFWLISVNNQNDNMQFMKLKKRLGNSFLTVFFLLFLFLFVSG